MTFPTIPTAAASRVITAIQANANNPRNANIGSLTKNPGDLLIVLFIAYQSSAANGTAWSGWTSGWTEFCDQGGASAGMTFGAAYKWSDGTETLCQATQAATVTGHMVMIAMSIPGAHASTPPVAGGMSTSDASSPGAQGLNPAAWDVEDTLWILVEGSGETSTTGSWSGIDPTPPANFSDAVITAQTGDVVGGVQGAVAFRQLAAASSGTVNAWSVDLSNARNGVVLFAVRPAAAAAAAAMGCGIPI